MISALLAPPRRPRPPGRLANRPDSRAFKCRRTVSTVLLCAGCGEKVSEWAARCPSCHQDASGAYWVEDPPQPEPLPAGSAGHPGVKADRADRAHARRRFRAALVVTAAGAGILVAVVAVVGGPSQSRVAIAPTPASLAGEVVGTDASEGIYTSSPSGAGWTSLVFTGLSAPAELVVAPDRRLYASQTYRSVFVYGSIPADPEATLSLPGSANLAGTSSFGDRDGMLLAADSSGPGSQLFLLPVSGAEPIPLGEGDPSGSAADPRTLGAFVVVGTARRPDPQGPTPALADISIELRRPGRPAVTIATSAGLARAAGDSGPAAFHLEVYPDPSGQRLGVVLEQPDSTPSDSAIVILDRSGRVHSVIPVSVGATSHVAVSWSPDGRLLAYSTWGRDGPAIAVWVGGRVVTRAVTDRYSPVGPCIWSPDGRYILCDAPPAGDGQVDEWVLAARSGPLVTVRGPGIPVAWVKS
jgi:hypothetical protein